MIRPLLSVSSFLLAALSILVTSSQSAATPLEFQPDFDRGYDTGYPIGYDAGFVTGQSQGEEEGTVEGEFREV